MDQCYGVKVSNRFDLCILEDEDPLEYLMQQSDVPKTKKKDEEKKAAKGKLKKPAAPEIKAKTPEQPLTKKEDKPVSARPGGRGGKREPREIRENDGDRKPQWRQGPKDYNREKRVDGDENVPPEFKARPEGGFRGREDREGGFGDRGRGDRGRGRARGRGGRGGERGGFGGAPRGSGGFGRREFDRHSANDRTGVKPTDKREGGGAHNWGSFKDDIEETEQQNVSVDWTGQEPQVEKTDDGENAEVEQVPVEDPEPQEMTLDEWKALQQQTMKPKSEFKIRQAGEGVDNAQWQKGREYHKKHEEEEEESEEEEDSDEEDDRHGKGKQLVTDIRITFNDNPQRGGRGRGRGRGGRGGPDREGRGGGPDREGRGGGRGRAPGGPRGMGGKPRDAAPRFDDESDFPSLVKSAA